MERIFFHAGDRVYTIDASHVRELATLGSFTPVPGASRKIAGVMQLRGKLVTILQLFAPHSHAPRAGDPLLIIECPLAATRVVVGVLIEGLADPVKRGDDTIAFDPVRVVEEIGREHGARS